MTRELEFDYSELKSRIFLKFKTQNNFAKALGISHSALNNKLNGRSEFDQQEIIGSVKLLDINENELKKYFFNEKS